MQQSRIQVLHSDIENDVCPDEMKGNDPESISNYLRGRIIKTGKEYAPLTTRKRKPCFAEHM